ncbi:2-oxoacid:acceptor oxidoreductase family protein [Desulfoscipio gibsoniae]|uniref:2-oxoacid:acceptor oxidoreductase family protein n=1 Tax=Desulfoscipio gibsoniae TaxID=102134 RepID=UPI00030B16A7|nr:2-oxoacid:acceptor oxidoreductase family protein [Desulfoscipio gibsoniae]
MFAIDATDKANALGNSRAANLVMLGAMMCATGLIEREIFGKGLNAYFEKKGYNTPSNLECYNIGYEQAEEK